MRWLLLLAFVVLIPSPVAAEPLQVAPERVSAVVTEEWNDDGARDRALLVETEDAADLLIYLSTGPWKPMKLHTRVAGIAWRGGLWGQQPTLGLSSAKSLELTAMNLGMGRYPWESTLTIAFKDGVFLVTDYFYRTYDRLTEDGGDGGNCKVNLLTGEGTRNDKAFRTDLRAMPVAEWAEEKRPPECRFFE